MSALEHSVAIVLHTQQQHCQEIGCVAHQSWGCRIVTMQSILPTKACTMHKATQADDEAPSKAYAGKASTITDEGSNKITPACRQDTA